jgi:hypothetical protein
MEQAFLQRRLLAKMMLADWNSLHPAIPSRTL